MIKHSHICDVTTADNVIRSAVELAWDEAKQHFVLVVLDADTREVLYDCESEEERHKTLEQYLWFLRCHKVILPGIRISLCFSRHSIPASNRSISVCISAP
ncbi:hypothetical protein ALO41_200226 [Pseudomonas amygdali pv. ulmi]|uniref:Replication protein A n=1 Tax=Pseudomonas amygdali pv. ulmi TaxID=251720 RepID=A0A0Q0CM03_PSEA0|nr:hypothetical protein ALO41_200226 [Pseudomonas amygdali pv. ulmi]